MLGCALHSGLHNKVACFLVQHGVVCCLTTAALLIQAVVISIVLSFNLLGNLIHALKRPSESKNHVKGNKKLNLNH